MGSRRYRSHPGQMAKTPAARSRCACSGAWGQNSPTGYALCAPCEVRRRCWSPARGYSPITAKARSASRTSSSSGALRPGSVAAECCTSALAPSPSASDCRDCSCGARCAWPTTAAIAMRIPWQCCFVTGCVPRATRYSRISRSASHFRHSPRRLGGSRAPYEGYLEKICGLIEWLQARGCTVRVIIGDLAYDAAVRSDLRALLQRRGASVSADAYADAPATSWQELLGQLEPVDFVIASRFHNLVLGLMLGKPSISLSYEPKNEALMQQMGLSEYCQTLDGLDLEQLTDQFVRLEKNADSLRAAIGAQVLVNRDRLGEQYHLVAVEVSAT